jgi:hypothetical protein
MESNSLEIHLESQLDKFRAEFFNIFNHANFNNPDTAISGAGAGGIFVARDGRDNV